MLLLGMHEEAIAPSIEQIIRPRPLAKRLNVHVTTLWRWTKDGRFPAPLQLGLNSIGWRESDVAAWLASRGR